MAAKRSSSSKKAPVAKAASPRGEKIPIGGSEINPSDLKGLRRAWNQGNLVLFLGAGVSIPYGLPSWRDLVLELLFDQTQDTRRLGRLWPHYRRALAEWMTDYFDYNPLVLARMVEKALAARSPTSPARAFLKSLQSKLYEDLRTPPAGERTLLRSIADLVEASNRETGVQRVVTFNFDDLLEEELSSRKVGHVVVPNGQRQYEEGFQIIHPHGFIPREGQVRREDIIFNETDYHHLTESVFHWGLAEIISSLRHCTVLFIGLSMSDPSLRRLLDAARNSKIPAHWQIQRRHSVSPADMTRVMEDVSARAQNMPGT